jgi:putative endonuclease
MAGRIYRERTGLGRAGESAAAALYTRSGFRILERNRRIGRVEVDLIARRGPLVVFCEVKTRHTDEWGQPSEAVGHAKQARMRRFAAQWLTQEHPGRVTVRFDVVSVIVRNGRLELTHVQDAF